MFRVRIKGTGVKSADSPDQEPDFYKLPAVGSVVTVGSSLNCVFPLEATYPALLAFGTEQIVALPVSLDDESPILPLDLKIDPADWFAVDDCLKQDGDQLPSTSLHDSVFVADSSGIATLIEHDWFVDFALDLSMDG
jgi:hypothetical protein